MRRVGIVLGAVAFAVVPSVAQAGRIELTGTAGPAAEVFPLYRAAPGERNRVVVKLVKGNVAISDSGARRVRITRDGRQLCKQRGRRAVFCRGSFFAELHLGDRGDRVRFVPGRDSAAPNVSDPLKLASDYSDTEGAPTETTYVFGGPGDDTITGSNEDDYIVGGPGRDRIYGRGGDDTLDATPDGVRDRLDGGGGIDELQYGRVKKGVTVDLAAGTSGPDPDSLTGIERVHGSERADKLMGTDGPDALYGQGGNDTIDGRGGNDLLTGDSPLGGRGVNTLTGGDGDDVIDARGSALAPTSTITCGPGADRVVSDTDDLLDGTCEADVFRVPADYLPDEQPLFATPVAVKPVAQDGTSASFDVPCPPTSQYSGTGCHGTVALEKPPPASPAETYGTGSFDLSPGAHQVVKVNLNADGQSALAQSLPIAVHVTGEIAPTTPISGRTPPKIDFGWQSVLQP